VECERLGIRTLTVTTTPRAWPRNRDLTAPTHHVRAALGLHPQLAAERFEELGTWESYLPEARYVGEVGLDAGSRYYASFDVQKRVFERVLRACAEAGGKILTVHSVRCAPAVLDMLERFLPRGTGRVVLHWFTGSRSDCRRAVELGCFFSINREMLRSPRRRAVVAELPADRLLTETDGPFVSVEGRPVRPKDVSITAHALADARGESVEALTSLVEDNLRALLSP
jgi:TatD DNase family protein